MWPTDHEDANRSAQEQARKDVEAEQEALEHETPTEERGETEE